MTKKKRQGGRDSQATVPMTTIPAVSAVKYPCGVCGKEVDIQHDKQIFGHINMSQTTYWHSSCYLGTIKHD